MKIAIHGAEGTGKDALATALARVLNRRGGQQARIAVSPPVDASNWDLTLVSGLDWVEADSPSEMQFRAQRESEDTLLRAALTAAGVEFQVVYGSSDVRLAKALKALKALKAVDALVAGADITSAEANSRGRPAWRWECDKCGDASCEHQLFSQLLRSATTAD